MFAVSAAYTASFFSEVWDKGDKSQMPNEDSKKANCQRMRSFLSGMQESRFENLIADIEVHTSLL